jgi:uncharacterized protein YbbC (DUF1343 family)
MNPCLCGLDRLHNTASTLESLLLRWRDRRAGLLSNQTGCTRDGVPALQVLHDAGVPVVALFSPEHGPQGNREGAIESSRTTEGLPVHSLYGATRRPTGEMLQDIDVLICDLQDVGARFYTYASTLAYVMEECATYGVEVVVLDRPNPLGGSVVEGPMFEAAQRSFVGYLNVPVRHGLTMGELALLHCGQGKLALDLEIIKVEGWQRSTIWPATQLPWRVPSPNLPDYQAAAWYPGLCLLEFCLLSVGRGTPAPFQILGAPWLEPAKVLSAMQNWPDELRRSYQAEAIEFVPSRATFEGEACRGLRFTTTAKGNIPEQPVALGLALLSTLHTTHADVFDAEQLRKALPLLGSSCVLQQLQNGAIAGAWQSAQDDAQSFQTQRQPFLLYS